MRTKIKVDKKYYKPVPWFDEGECTGCHFNKTGAMDCPNGNSDACDSGNEFEGVIFIPHTKEAMAEYIAKKLGAPDVVEEA